MLLATTQRLPSAASRQNIPFPIRCWPTWAAKIIDAYGIRNQDAPERVKGSPYPGTFIVGTDGNIRAKLFPEGYEERASLEAIIAALKSAK